MDKILTTTFCSSDTLTGHGLLLGLAVELVKRQKSTKKKTTTFFLTETDKIIKLLT